MKKPLFVIIVLLISMLINGCNLNSTDSNKYNDWKEVTVNVPLYEMIYDGNSRGSTELEGGRKVEYFLCYPASWTLSGTVFVDNDLDHKVAETGPVVLLKQGEEAEFLDYKTVEGEIITKESIDVAEYKGTKVILQHDTEKESWYPHMYMISDGTYGFTMTIYSHNQIRDEVEEKLFDDIVNTFRFKQ